MENIERVKRRFVLSECLLVAGLSLSLSLEGGGEMMELVGGNWQSEERYDYLLRQ